MTTSREPDFYDPIIAHVLFTDGARRAVFLDLEGRQYVVDEGERVDGQWLDPETVPFAPDATLPLSRE